MGFLGSVVGRKRTDKNKKTLQTNEICLILWHIDPLLYNDRETNNEKMTVARKKLRK
jgi:hypothetical protein